MAGLSLIFLTALFTFAQEASAQSPFTTFHNRAYQASIVLGNYLYIDGGGISFWSGIGSGEFGYNGENLENEVNLPVNSTYSLDLSESWTNKTANLVQISKGNAPIVGYEALWPDISRGAGFFSYGGLPSVSANYTHPADLPANSLWHFAPGAGSGGTWKQATVLANSDFSNVSRTAASAHGYGNGLGFSLGGHNGQSLVSGLVIFNQSSGQWSNVSSTNYSTSYSYNGAGQFVRPYGPNGLFFVLGGLLATSESALVDGQTWSNPASFDVAYMFDPVSEQWQTQQVTGDQPVGVASPCVVGVQGNQSYEIFLYGGYAGNVNDTVSQGAVYVLTLPAFHWFRQDAHPTFGRWQHSCNVLGSTRQMVSVGGITVNASSKSQILGGSLGGPDPWPQGLGVFDMSEMQWVDEYNPNALPYETPNRVQAWYSSNGRYPATWTSPTVQAWFNGTGDPGNGTTTTTSTTSSSPAPASTSSAASSSSSAGAIAGGVVGGLVGLAFIVGLLVFFRRRQRRRRRHAIGRGADDASWSIEQHYQGIRDASQPPKPGTFQDAVEADGQEAPAEADSKERPGEMDGSSQEAPGEMDGQSEEKPWEMQGSETAQELPA